MTSLICGSIAFDTIMSFGGRFSEALLADQLHKINVAFLVPSIRREFGGCAGNIAYNLKLLGGDPLIMATVGQDSGPYIDRLERLQISRRCIQTIESSYTAQAFITTDRVKTITSTRCVRVRLRLFRSRSSRSSRLTAATACCNMQRIAWI